MSRNIGVDSMLMKLIRWIKELFTPVTLIPANMPEHQRLKLEQKAQEAREKEQLGKPKEKVVDIS